MGCCAKGGSSGSMQCVWKEGGGELNPLHNMWLLGTRVMFRSARKFGKSGTWLCVQSVYRCMEKGTFDDVKLECVGEFAYIGDMLNDTGAVDQAVAARVKATWMKFRELGGILCMRGTSL